MLMLGVTYDSELLEETVASEVELEDSLVDVAEAEEDSEIEIETMLDVAEAELDEDSEIEIETMLDVAEAEAELEVGRAPHS